LGRRTSNQQIECEALEGFVKDVFFEHKDRIQTSQDQSRAYEERSHRERETGRQDHKGKGTSGQGDDEAILYLKAHLKRRFSRKPD
jgi:hypothetical protein